MGKLAHGTGVSLGWAGLCALLGLWSLTVVAQPASGPDPRYALCPPDTAIPPRPFYDSRKRAPGFVAGTVQGKADEVRVPEVGRSVLVGGVELVRDRQAVAADLLTYRRDRGIAEAEGHIRYWDPTIFWSGRHALVEFDSDRARLVGGAYRLPGRRAHGEARTVTHNSRKDETRLTEVDYTTCEAEVPEWRLEARRMKINHDEHWGEAYHVFLNVLDVPIFYTPYITFPISDRRKSGFLPPTIGSSDDTGFDFTLPYYWNIAPEMDATLAPRLLSDRGVLLGGQYRYLMRRGDGQLDAEYLPVDSERDDDARWLIGYAHEQRFAGHRGHLFLDFTRVSDEQYFDDFGTSLALTSRRYLEQRADARYSGDLWNVLARFQGYQTVDDTIPEINQPYDRLPQVYFNAYTPRREGGLNLDLLTQSSYFSRGAGPVGGRIDLRPVVSVPFHTAGTFLVPRLGVEYTQYLLDQPATGTTATTADETPNRLLPILSVDSGLLYERDLGFGGRTLLQTLEPRFFYLYIPEVDQDDLPIFDTGQYTVSFGQLFRENRFSGPDRVGDANQISLGVTSRFIDRDSGFEHLRLSIGQSYYFADREVALPRRPPAPPPPIDDDPVSDVAGELVARFTNGLSARADVIFDRNDTSFDLGLLGLRYLPDSRTIVNAEYRIRRDIVGIDETGAEQTDIGIEQTDVSLRLPVTPALSVVGRWNYSLDGNETLEAAVGLEYESCCYAVRTVARRFLHQDSSTRAEDDTTLDNQIFVQLELKGLAGFGRSTTSFLKRSIPGYENDLTSGM
ncbi:MAG: LPS assembly protein LptD [Pseudomonadota bacterium]|nr:LPS assembly protein LptD [Pseudomonadota bacterium]